METPLFLEHNALLWLNVSRTVSWEADFHRAMETEQHVRSHPTESWNVLRKRAWDSLPAPEPFHCRGNNLILFLGRLCAPLSERRVEQVFCEHKVTDCSCLGWGEGSPEIPPYHPWESAHRRWRAPWGVQPSYTTSMAQMMTVHFKHLQAFTFSEPWIMIYYIYMWGKVKNNTKKLRSGGGLLSAQCVFIKAAHLLAYRLK